MEKLQLKKDFIDERNELTRCLVCDTYVHPQESFTCPKCKKSPLCRRHRVPDRKECASCYFDLRMIELNALRNMENNIGLFLKFLQFVFIICAIVFISLKTGLSEFVEVLQFPQLEGRIVNFISIPIGGYILFFLILYNLRRKETDMVEQLSKLEFRR